MRVGPLRSLLSKAPHKYVYLYDSNLIQLQAVGGLIVEGF
jgi:hypothetical protein